MAQLRAATMQQSCPGARSTGMAVMADLVLWPAGLKRSEKRLRNLASFGGACCSHMTLSRCCSCYQHMRPCCAGTFICQKVRTPSALRCLPSLLPVPHLVFCLLNPAACTCRLLHGVSLRRLMPNPTAPAGLGLPAAFAAQGCHLWPGHLGCAALLLAHRRAHQDPALLSKYKPVTQVPRPPSSGPA